MSNPSTFHWTYEDYVRLTDGEEYFEFIDGRAIRKPRAERRGTRGPAGRFSILLAPLSVEDTRARRTSPSPPLDVVFADDTVLQPDIIVISERAPRPYPRRPVIFGAPDFVIEVLSPSTASRDRREKLAVYARYGVREYWLVDPERARIEVFVLESGRPREEGRARLRRGPLARGAPGLRRAARRRVREAVPEAIGRPQDR